MGSILCLALAQQAAARDGEVSDFVQSNIIGIFYHELGHAVIDVMQLPVFGQEEDAADVASVLLIDWLFDEQNAQSIAYDSAFGYLNDPEGEDEIAWWSVHGPDEQRFYNHVCLFYGGNPDAQDDFAEDLGLPEERAETCSEEYELAADSWSPVFDDLEAGGFEHTLKFNAGAGRHADAVNRVISDEVDALNAQFSFPSQIVVRVESCGEANAFYDPADTTIVFCLEFVSHLQDLEQAFHDR